MTKIKDKEKDSQINVKDNYDVGKKDQETI